MKIKFPKNFYWGSATSAHQVEGNNKNSDWWIWESEGKVANHEKSGKACDFWNRYKEDLKLSKKLGHNAFRFSMEWAKVIKSQNQKINKSNNQENNESSDHKINKIRNQRNIESINQGDVELSKQEINKTTKQIISKKVIQHYQDVVDYCNKLELEPFVTLHHFSNPTWFSKFGGWEKKENVQYFLEYVDLITKQIKGVKYWLTINEPCVYANAGYVKGVWPPGKKNIASTIKVVNNMIYAHNEAYKIIKQNQPKSYVGFSKNNAYFEGMILAKFAKKYWNHYFLDKTVFDFIGLNYYFHDKLVLSIIPPFFKIKNDNQLVSDMNWEVYPEGIYKVLMDLKKYKKMIIITENGIADKNDRLRGKFIKEHLKYTYKALQKGVDVRGYLHWSLLDNFEWAHGYKSRFGLLKVEYKTQKRTLRPSAKIYEKICRSGTIEM